MKFQQISSISSISRSCRHHVCDQSAKAADLIYIINYKISRDDTMQQQ